MKNFKVGDRVAFDYSGQRYRGKIAIWGYSDKICINTKFEHELEMKYCTNIKRLVKKKRLKLWVIMFPDGLFSKYNYGTKKEALEAMRETHKIDTRFSEMKFVKGISVIKFKESK